MRDQGFSTAELLGNAALGIGVLVVIWLGLRGIGQQVLDYIGGAIFGG